ncbi:hypothetical protein G9F73_016515 [Clostridium estertheticum]|nr:hypothetical protein [Clostridium estertheticum]MBZ9609393.1 hypothetical protein [Clostridium estertheticum]
MNNKFQVLFLTAMSMDKYVMYGIGLSAVCISNNRSRYGTFISNINSFV